MFCASNYIVFFSPIPILPGPKTPRSGERERGHDRACVESDEAVMRGCPQGAFELRNIGGVLAWG